MPGALRREHGPLDFRQRPARAVQERDARGGELHAPARPHQQRCAYDRFELAHLLAERWLRHVQPPSRPAEMQLLGHCNEIAQMTELDAHPDVLHIDGGHTTVSANTSSQRNFDGVSCAPLSAGRLGQPPDR